MKYLLWYQDIPKDVAIELESTHKLLIGKNGQPYAWITRAFWSGEYWEYKYNLPKFNWFKALYYKILIWWLKK